MKSFILSFVILMGLAVVQSVEAGTCNAGTEITGKNGHVYCVSNTSMNWWSAFAWCKTQGRHLVSIHEACDTNDVKWNGIYGQGSCLNLIGSDNRDNRGWTSVPFDNIYAHPIQLSSATYIYNDHTYTSRFNFYKALCY